MPSSSPMSSTQRVPDLPVHQKKSHGYRQTMYHDKAGIQIAESRRRSAVAGKVELSMPTYVDFVLYPMEDIQSCSKNRLEDVSCRAAPLAKSCSRSHVTSKHSSINRPKPAIIHAATEQSRTLSGGDKIRFQSSQESTPPPTPRMTRLSTPELVDFNEAPFCDCGVGRHIVRCCKTCSKEVDLWSVQ